MRYRWSGINSQGKKVSGIAEARNKILLKTNLVGRDIFPLKIGYDFSSIFTSYCPIHTKHINNVIEQLSILVNSNIPILKSLEIINQDELNPKIKNLIIKCKNSISDGKSLYQTLSQYPQYFNELLCNLINAGEQTGTLDIMLLDITNHLKKNELQKNKITKALLYPITILVIALIVTTILLIFVIPQFETMYSNFGAKLPGYTRGIIKLSNFLQTSWKVILSGIISAIICIKTVNMHSMKWRLLLDRLYLNIPLIKNIVIACTITQLTKTLSLALKSGIPLLSAINISLTTISNRQYQLALQNGTKLIANGQSLHSALSEQNVLPSRVIQLIMLGEETGALDSMLEKVSVIYNDELNRITDNLNNLLEPIIMLILGVLVGGLIIGMYLPIFRLGMIV